MADHRQHPFVSARGFTVIEMAVVAALIALVSGMAMLVAPGVLARAKTDGGAQNLLALLRTAREQAISQRRNMRVDFLEDNRIQVSRVEVPGPGTTLLLDARLELGTIFVKFPPVPDTPDAFGAADAVDFGTANALNFTSEGTFVDQNGDELNGTVFLGLANRPETAQAVTVFGPTAYVRTWRWDGSRWVE